MWKVVPDVLFSEISKLQNDIYSTSPFLLNTSLG